MNLKRKGIRYNKLFSFAYEITVMVLPMKTNETQRVNQKRVFQASLFPGELEVSDGFGMSQAISPEWFPLTCGE